MNNDLVYVTDYDGLTIFDVRRPQELKQLGSLVHVTSQGFADFEIVGDRAYLVEDQGGIWIVEIHDPQCRHGWQPGLSWQVQTCW